MNSSGARRDRRQDYDAGNCVRPVRAPRAAACCAAARKSPDRHRLSQDGDSAPLTEHQLRKRVNLNEETHEATVDDRLPDGRTSRSPPPELVHTRPPQRRPFLLVRFCYLPRTRVTDPARIASMAHCADGADRTGWRGDRAVRWTGDADVVPICSAAIRMGRPLTLFAAPHPRKGARGRDDWLTQWPGHQASD